MMLAYNNILDSIINFVFTGYFHATLYLTIKDFYSVTNIALVLCIFNFVFNLDRPLLLILFLEIMYLILNINFLISWLYLNFYNGILYVFIIIGIAGAETILGLLLIIKLYNTKINFLTILTAKLSLNNDV